MLYDVVGCGLVSECAECVCVRRGRAVCVVGEEEEETVKLSFLRGIEYNRNKISHYPTKSII